VIAHHLFAAWDRYRQHGDRARLRAQTGPLQDKLCAMLEHAAGRARERSTTGSSPRTGISGTHEPLNQAKSA
jgi:hypothetical protein